MIPTLTLSAPTEVAGSKHTVYLVRCEPNECPIGACDPGEFLINAAAYFRSGPVSGSSRVKPTSLVQIDGNQPAWEGQKRTFKLGREGTFTTNIPTSAKTADKGSIAGDATLGSEPFVCFKDGTTKFTTDVDDDRYTCSADYYCPSIDVGGGDNNQIAG